MYLLKLVDLGHCWLTQRNMAEYFKTNQLSDELIAKDHKNHTLNEEITVVLYGLWKLSFTFDFHVLQNV